MNAPLSCRAFRASYASRSTLIYAATRAALRDRLRIELGLSASSAARVSTLLFQGKPVTTPHLTASEVKGRA